jgi:hypothetical protein
MTGQFWTYVRYALFFTAILYSAAQDKQKRDAALDQQKREQMDRAERATALAAQLHYPKP